MSLTERLNIPIVGKRIGIVPREFISYETLVTRFRDVLSDLSPTTAEFAPGVYNANGFYRREGNLIQIARRYHSPDASVALQQEFSEAIFRDEIVLPGRREEDARYYIDLSYLWSVTQPEEVRRSARLQVGRKVSDRMIRRLRERENFPPNFFDDTGFFVEQAKGNPHKPFVTGYLAELKLKISPNGFGIAKLVQSTSLEDSADQSVAVRTNELDVVVRYLKGIDYEGDRIKWEPASLPREV